MTAEPESESTEVDVVRDDAARLLNPHMPDRSQVVLDAVHRYEVADLHLRVRLASRLGISLGDLAALRHIRRRELDQEPVRVRDLERWLKIPNASASVVTDRLRAAGLIVKRPGTGDRRERRLELTDLARARLDEAAGDSPDALNAVLQTVTADESQRIVELLDAITDVLQQTTV